MQVPVLTAVTDAVWEAKLLTALERGDLGIRVVRRCVDLADLLATAATGQARAVLLSADLRRLDREALGRLAVSGVAVVGLVPPDDEHAERHLRQLGLVHVLSADTTPTELAGAVLEAVRTAAPPSSGQRRAVADPRTALPLLPDQDAGDPDVELQAGKVVAVWGPTGAPGRTTVAVTLASELAGLGSAALLIDADVYGGVVAQVLGLLDEAPGLAAAARLANNGALDLPALAGLARAVTPTFLVLSGISRADRWPELRPAAVEVVLSLARSLARTVVVDCGFCLEQDEELSYDTAAPRRNGATLAVLEAADVVYAVGSCDPVALQRLVRGLAELREAVPGVQPRVLVNRLRPGGVPGDVEKEVRAALSRYAGVESVTFIPSDVVALDRALAAGRTLGEAAPTSPARLAVASLAADLLGVTPARSRRRARGR
jgi:MinD-like ATPase involved in chromosome partitioning or flagellar assembly